MNCEALLKNNHDRFYELRGASNEYPQHVFEEIMKQDVSISSAY